MNQKNLNHTTIESLNHEGLGVSHIDNKVIFLENALPHEEVKFIYTKRYSTLDMGNAIEILTPSPSRVSSYCKHSNICGGCTLQHLDHKEQLKHISNLEIKNILPPITGPVLGYRNKARLSSKYVLKKHKVLVGFHEKHTSYIVETDECPILHKSIGKKISLLSKLVADLSIYAYIPQIEIACGDETTSLVLRNLQKFSEADIKLVNDFADEHKLQIYSQSGGIDSAELITLNQLSPLYYNLPNQNIRIFFSPTDFTQINHAVNTQLVDYVMMLLEIEPSNKILDLYCGIGNFTLPVATKCLKICGIEGNKNAVIRAKQNAEYNNIRNAEFYAADLTRELSGNVWNEQQYDKIILDPSRVGAEKICSQIKKFGAKKIIYVSCNSSTFARDTKTITNQGYELQNITLVDMYPHTSHMEIVGLYERLSSGSVF